MLEEVLKRSNWKDVLIVIIAAIAIIGIWRGTWNLLDRYLLPNNFNISQTISILVGIIILFILSRKK